MHVIRIPTSATLAKYGLSEADYVKIIESQGGVCAVCEQSPSSGRLCVDHFHATGWKKMKPSDRKLFVRGLLCFFCNTRYMGRGINIRKARNVVSYLEDFEARISGC